MRAQLRRRSLAKALAGLIPDFKPQHPAPDPPDAVQPVGRPRHLTVQCPLRGEFFPGPALKQAAEKASSLGPREHFSRQI